MRKTVLFIAMSLDGYIADEQGGVSWINGQGDPEDMIDVYSSFVKNVDTIFVGWNTYHQVVTELSPEEWVYQDFTTYVFTHKQQLSSPQIRFTGENPVDMLKRLKEEKGKDIWICGGADLIGQLMQDDCIDEYYLSVIPVLLGKGIRLFGNFEKEKKLKLCKVQSYNGITDLVYTRR